jgi:CHAD domain-containing protein
VGETAGKTIQCALDRVFNISRTIKKKTSNKKLHQLRISIKKLRYACEFYKQIASPQMGLLIKKTVQLQDILGQIQDTLITIRLFSSNISTIRLNNNAKKYLRKEIHQLIDSKEKSLKEARKIFFKKWKAFKSKKSLYLLEKLL